MTTSGYVRCGSRERPHVIKAMYHKGKWVGYHCKRCKAWV